jgi:HSP20 family protein
MAEFGTRKQRTEEETGLTPSERAEGIVGRQAGGIQRGYGPSIFSVSPGEFFTMSPFSLMRRLSEDIDKVFSGRTGSLSRAPAQQDVSWIPAVEVRESGNNFVVRADLPGLTEKDVKVEATDEGLAIEGERRQEQTSEHGGIHHSERVYGHFYRLIPLPEGAKIDEAKANFQNGVLEVIIPVPEAQRKRRQIPIGSLGSGQAKGAAAGR